MQIPCTHEAPFSSLLSRNGSCLPRQDNLGLKVDGMDQATAYITGRSTAPCAHETACVRARTQYVAQTMVPSMSHRHDVPEVEFKKKTQILATLRDLFKGLSGMRRVFAGFCKFQVVHDATVSLWFVNWDLQRYTGRQTVQVFKNEALKLLQTTTQALKNCSIFKILFFR